MKKFRRFHRLNPGSLLLGVLLSLWLPVVAGATAQQLHERYAALEPQLRTSAFKAPIHVEADDRDGILRGEAYGVLTHRFDVFRSTLQQLPVWCDLVTLHFNIKACAHRTQDGARILTLFTGSKGYENPKKARQIDFVYTLRAAGADYFDAVLTSASGPLDTRDYRIEIAAVPMGDLTFTHVRFSYRYGALTRMASTTYYATLGRKKVGFSVIGADSSGKPLYVKGRNGAVERTAMLSYLALQALFEGLAQPEAQRFEWRLKRWYALIDRYPRQLHEVEEEEYLQVKRKERGDMVVSGHEAWPQEK